MCNVGMENTSQKTLLLKTTVKKLFLIETKTKLCWYLNNIDTAYFYVICNAGSRELHFVNFPFLWLHLASWFLPLKNNTRGIAGACAEKANWVNKNWGSLLPLVELLGRTADQGMVWNGMEDDFSIFHTGNFLPFHFHSVLKTFHSIFHSIVKFSSIFHSILKFSSIFHSIAYFYT